MPAVPHRNSILVTLEHKLNLLSDEKIQKMSRMAEAMMEGEHSRERFHCSEAFLISVGTYLFEGVEDGLRRLTTGLAGGVGGTHEEMCGALVGGILIIGAMYGRARPTEDDQPAYRLSVHYRNKFIEQMGGAKCHQLREMGYGSGGHTPCGVLVGRAIPIFFEAVRERKQLFVENDAS
jgi:C_GCAxxG_C_C family probable redox protein